MLDHQAGSRSWQLLSALALVVMAVLVTAGDWPTYLHDIQRSSSNPTETIVSPANAPLLMPVWTFKTGGPIESSATVASGTVYVGSWDGNEYALNAANGAMKWQTNLGTDSSCSPTQGVSSSATVQNGVVYVGGGDSFWYALDAATGAVLWKVFVGRIQAGHYNWSSPLIYRGYAYIGIASMCDNPLVQGKLLQVSLSTHKITHVFDVVPAGQLGGSIWGSPTVDVTTNTIYVATGNEASEPPPTYTLSLLALDASTLALKSSWQIPPSQNETDSDFGSTPTLFTDASGRQLVGVENKNGYFYAFDRANLAAGPVWQVQIATSATGFPSGISPAAFANGTLYVGGADFPSSGHVRALNPATGAVLWAHTAPGNIFGAIVYANGLVIDAGGNTLEVLNAANGTPLYSYNTGGETSASPSIANGQIYQGSQDDTLYAFGLPTGPVAALSPASLDFGGEVLGASSITQTVTLTNVGTLPLTVTNVSIAGANAGDFSVVSDTCVGATLAPGNTCSMGLRFAPAALGSRAATLSVTDNAHNSPQSVPLTGLGLAAPCVPSGNPTSTPYAQMVLADAPVAYWRLDETCPGTIVDYSGNGHYGQTSGGVTVGVTGAISGDSDTAMRFDGTSGIVGLSGLHGIPGGNTAYTLEAWVKLQGPSNPDNSNQGFIGYGNYYTINQVNAFRNNGCNQLDNYWWGNDLVTPSFATNLCDGAYHYVVATYDMASDTRTIYLDGKQVGQDHPATPNIQLENFTLAKTCCNEYLQGSLDEVAIYDHALSAARVLAHYQAGTTAPPIRR